MSQRCHMTKPSRPNSKQLRSFLVEENQSNSFSRQMKLDYLFIRINFYFIFNVVYIFDGTVELKTVTTG
jgi:hypothetical protein